MYNVQRQSGLKVFKRIFSFLKWLAGATLLIAVLASCTQLPKGVKPVKNFELEQYLGEWHEVARLDHRFEEGLTHVSATYLKRDDGGLEVINRGWNQKENTYSEAIGRAYFIDDTSVGSLKVSFFGPFYGGYHIAKLDKEYQMALVLGPSTDYAWILARSKQPNKELCEAFYKAAETLGINRGRWIVGYTCQ